MKNKIFYMFGTVLICLLLCCLVGCGDNSDTANEQAESETNIEESLEVETSFGSLFYPEQFREFLKVESDEDDNEYTFWGEVDDQQIELFTIRFVKEKNERCVGKLKTDSGMVFVEVELEDIDDTEMTEDMKNRLYAMQEGVNDLLDELKKEGNFKSI